MEGSVMRTDGTASLPGYSHASGRTNNSWARLQRTVTIHQVHCTGFIHALPKRLLAPSVCGGTKARAKLDRCKERWLRGRATRRASPRAKRIAKFHRRAGPEPPTAFARSDKKKCSSPTAPRIDANNTTKTNTRSVLAPPRPRRTRKDSEHVYKTATVQGDTGGREEGRKISPPHKLRPGEHSRTAQGPPSPHCPPPPASQAEVECRRSCRTRRSAATTPQARHPQAPCCTEW